MMKRKRNQEGHLKVKEEREKKTHVPWVAATHWAHHVYQCVENALRGSDMKTKEEKHSLGKEALA